MGEAPFFACQFRRRGAQYSQCFNKFNVETKKKNTKHISIVNTYGKTVNYSESVPKIIIARGKRKRRNREERERVNE